jgi:L-threonylcarbamoyladenylate synthase
MSPSPAAKVSHDLRQALLVLTEGGVVAFPTETYYGLAVDPFNPRAVDRLFVLKGRPLTKPVALLIDHPGRLPLLAAHCPPQFQPLMARFWPGPLTLIFPSLPHLSPLLTAGSGSIGLRISSHPLAHALTSQAGGIITATSANLTGLPPAVSVDGITAQFGQRLDWLLQADPTPGGAASTIVAATPSGLRLIREGVIPFAEIEQVAACGGE